MAELPLWPARVETHRCTGHCCDPIQVSFDPGHLRKLECQQRFYPGDEALPGWLVYLGWRPPSKGGWAKRGCHEYRCIHFDQRERRCLIHSRPRPWMCTEYPTYNDGGACTRDGCTRRTEPAPEEVLRIMRGAD